MSLIRASLAETISVGILSSSGTQRSMYTSLAKEFETQNPTIQIELLFRNDADYKRDLNTWFNQDSGPQILNWQGGERLYQYVRKGLVQDLSDFWSRHKLEKSFSEGAIGAVTYQQRRYAIPISYYQWGMFYRESVFNKLNLSPPQDWQAFLQVCETLKQNDIIPITIGAQNKWPTAAWFDYLNLRINGLEFHQQLLQGEIIFTDKRVREVFEHWKVLLDSGYFVDRFNGWNWQQAMPFMYHKLAGMTLIGNFYSGVLPEHIKSDFRFFRFPKVKDSMPYYEEAPLDLFMLPAYASRSQAMERFLVFLSDRKFQEKFNEELGMISPNLQSNKSQDYFIQQGTATLNAAQGLSQFFDRDSIEPMSNAATRIFTDFMQHKNIDTALEALEKARRQHFSS